MTAPVSQEPTGDKIEMTSPVGQQPAQEGWVVSFTMPASYTLETLPQPLDSRVALRQVPARRMAALSYSGLWNERRFLRHRMKLESWVRGRGLDIAGDFAWARYDPPFAPSVLRRNEILVPVCAHAGHDATEGREQQAGILPTGRANPRLSAPLLQPHVAPDHDA